MTLQQIAQQVSEEYNREPSDLRKKRYSSRTNIHDMKKAFVKRCYQEHIPPGDIADFLDHTPCSVSRLIRKTDFERDLKWHRIIERFRRKDTLHVKQDNYWWIPKLRDKGYCIANVGIETYKLIE